MRRVIRATTALVFVLLCSACGDRALRGSAIDPPKALQPVSLTTSEGASISWSSGKPTFVFFGYTHCPDVCPTTLANWARIRQRLGDRANDVQFVFVSVDAERDSVDVVRRYVRQFDAGIVGVTPDSATLVLLQQQLGASSFREADNGASGYLMAHSAQTFLVDGSGRLVAYYSFGSGWDTMLHDVETLL